MTGFYEFDEILVDYTIILHGYHFGSILNHIFIAEKKTDWWEMLIHHLVTNCCDEQLAALWCGSPLHPRRFRPSSENWQNLVLNCLRESEHCSHSHSLDFVVLHADFSLLSTDLPRLLDGLPA